jgi:tetratricopeptide (TPR) repeat protein
MMTLLLFFVSASPANPPHIKAAVSAYEAGKAALLKKQPAAGVELLAKAVEIEPTFLDAYKCLIDAQLATGDNLKAAAIMTQFLEIAPEANHYRILLAQILLGQKQWDRALAQYSIVLRDTPLDADALWGFASAAKELGMEDRASEALAKGRSHYPNNKRFWTP